jgi:hypothetical protein
MTESNKERRARVANDIRVKASPIRMPLNEFNDRYRGRQVIGTYAQREEVEKITQEMFCDECMKSVTPQVADGPTEGTLLHVTIEDDPLGNFWKLATMRCHHCGFHEHVPLTTPQFSPDDIGSGRNIAGSLLRTGSFTPGPTLAPDPYLIELSKMQAAHAQQVAQAQMAQSLGSMHGMAGQQNAQAIRRQTATEIQAKMQAAQQRMEMMAQRADNHLADALRYGFGADGSAEAEKTSRMRAMFDRLMGK